MRLKLYEIFYPGLGMCAASKRRRFKIKRAVEAAYQTNFQTKRRRRREGKTNYRHRIKMIRKKANRSGSVKYRLVVRTTNKKIICQIVGAYMGGDRVFCHAESTELCRYGVDFGLKNYFAAYATGFLVGKRILSENKCMLDEENVYGNNDDEKRTIKAFLDIGLARASRGARVFGAMKGASDAGLNIPHGCEKFYGYGKDGKLDTKVLHDRIFGNDISKYMMSLREKDPEKFSKQFSDYIRRGVDPENISQICKDALDKIEQDPSRNEREKKDYSALKKYKHSKLSYEERRTIIAEKLSTVVEE